MANLKELYSNASGPLKDYINSIGRTSMTSTTYLRDQDRAFRIEKRGGLTKLLASKTDHNTEVTETQPGWSDISIVDRMWVSSRFMVADKDINEPYRSNKYFTSTGWKLSSTRLGYNLAINAKPQFCRFTDLKGNTRAGATGTQPLFDEVTVGPVPGGTNRRGLGMGRYYSEAIDDNATTIFMQFGVPKFNSIFGFITAAVNVPVGFVANTGRIPLGYYAGRLVGGFVAFAMFPVITALIWGLKYVYQALASDAYKYYYLNPAMHVYWTTVNTIATQLAVELGFLPPYFLRDKHEASKLGMPVTLDKEDIAVLKEYMPDLVGHYSGMIDIFKVATKHQRMANLQARMERRKFEEQDGKDPKDIKIKPQDLVGHIIQSSDVTKPRRIPGEGFLAAANSYLQFSNFIDYSVNKIKGKPGMYSADASGKPLVGGGGPEDIPMDTNGGAAFINNEDGTYNIRGKSSLWFNDTAETFDAAMREGGQYAVFHVNYQGSVSESVSSSTSSLELQDGINSVSKTVRRMHTNLAGGNVIPGVDAILDQIKGFAMGSADSVSYGLSGIIYALMNGALVEMPKKWEDTNISLSSVRYEIDLVSPYGDPISQLQNIYIPLAMLLAGSLPLSTGMNSYTSPFLCSVFNKGVQEIKLGMITSLNIERGTGNVGFSTNKRALAMRVSFTVTDFNEMLTAPVNAGIFEGIMNPGLNYTTNFGIFMGTIASRDFYSMRYGTSKLKQRAAQMMMSVDQLVSGVRLGFFAGSLLSPVVSILTEEKRLNITQQNGIHFY